MSFSDQTSPKVLTGTTVADLPSPASMPEGYIFRSRSDGQALALEIDPATHVRRWAPFVSSGAMGWPKYVVSPSGDPAAQYTSIQTAINAAAAAGHGPSNPTAVYVLPGSLTEPSGTITMVPGIDVIGLSGTVFGSSGQQTDVTYTGNILFNFVQGSASIIGLTVLGVVDIVTTGAVAIGIINTTVFGNLISANNVSAIVFLQNSSFIAASGNDKGADLEGSSIQIQAIDSVFSGHGSGSAIALSWSQGSVFSRCTFNGTVSGQNLVSGSAVVEFRGCTFNPGGHTLMSITAGGIAIITDGEIIGSTVDPMFISNGGTNATLKINGLVNTVGNHISINPTFVSSSQTFSFRDYTESNIAGSSPFAIPQATMTDLFTVTQTGAWTCTLPSLAGVFSGTRITIDNLHATPGQCTLTPAGADTVNTQVSYTTAGNTRSVTLQARSDGGTTDWRIVSISPL